MPLYPEEEFNVPLLFPGDADIVELGVAISAAKVLRLQVLPFGGCEGFERTISRFPQSPILRLLPQVRIFAARIIVRLFC